MESTTRAELLQRLSEAQQAATSLTLFFTGEPDPVFDAMTRLLHAAADDAAGVQEVTGAYRALFRLLADEAEFSRGELVGDAWKTHLLNRLLADENAFSRRAALGEGEISPALRAAAEGDLQRLQVLYRIESRLFVAAVARRQRVPGPPPTLGGMVPWEELRSLRAETDRPADPDAPLKRALAESNDWSALVDDLAQHYARSGSGLFHRFRAFRWVADGDGGHLEGVAYPDPVRLEDLIAYDEERQLLLRNTEHFLAGSPANDVLLYGDRGTGKSSTIKALLNAYGDRGLRLIEVPKQHLAHFPRILELLRPRRERFILFVDDLSFEEHETYYKELKAVLEGGLEARPGNVLLYATSNRRHLITERFSDREGSAGEVHARDAVQEKLSLSDRFGITVTFPSPDQETYLEIVEGLARRMGVEMERGDLRRKALQWAARHNGWSGRTARQFINFVLGEQRAAAGEACSE
ncbi:MAG: ATP-binding protein [Armatimonadota bacterium]|nr:ATP-binding protein [Armatimonadota bacterium]